MKNNDLFWHEKALCKDLPLEDFFIDKLNSRNKSVLSSIFSTCDVCPVAVECLQDALNNDDEGIRAGSNYHHRQHILNRFFKKTKKKISLEEASAALSSIRFYTISFRIRIGRNSSKRGIFDDLL
jgi:hypothetical protein